STPSGQRIAVIAWNDLAAPPRAHLAEAITLGRAQSDLLVCFVHWGEENTAEVTDRERELARWLIDAGVDLVAGAHPHCTQPLEFYRGRPILYSLGNLVFDGAPTVAAWNRGQLAQITLTGKRGAAVRLLPIQLDVRGFPYEPSARPTAGAVRSRQRVMGFSKNR
ncbi:MAG: CapA family protein, partial [Chthoniobacterales bacterium]